MKNFLLPVSLVAACVAFPATAGTQNFAGLSVGMNGNFTDSRTQLKYPQGPDGSVKSRAFKPSVQIQYSFGLTENGLLAVGAEVLLGSGNPGQSAYVAPGYVVSENFQWYAKLARVTDRMNAFDNEHPIYGTGLGLGLQYAFTSQVSLKAEYMNTRYDDVSYKQFGTTPTVEKTSASAFMLGISYKF